MKVLNRDQITEVVIKRTIFHSLEYKGQKYSRVLTTKTTTPYMDENVEIHKPKLEWRLYTKDNVVEYIDKSLEKELEKEYQALSIREKNGDV